MNARAALNLTMFFSSASPGAYYLYRNSKGDLISSNQKPPSGSKTISRSPFLTQMSGPSQFQNARHRRQTAKTGTRSRLTEAERHMSATGLTYTFELQPDWLSHCTGRGAVANFATQRNSRGTATKRDFMVWRRDDDSLCCRYSLYGTSSSFRIGKNQPHRSHAVTGSIINLR